MRSVTAVLFWLVATLALAVAIPAGWAQRNLIDEGGYAALAKSAGQNQAIQDATGSLLSTQAVAFAADRGFNLPESAVRGAAAGYTSSSSFPGQFADVNRVAHRWLFTDAVRQDGDRWTVDVAPMLSNLSIIQTLNARGLPMPSSVRVPVTSDTVQNLRPGELRPLATWGPWISTGAAALAGVAALLTLAVAKARGKALAALGVSALLVGGGGYAAMEVGRRYLDGALNRTTGDVRTIADVMVSHAEAGLHHWLNLTLAVGGAVVVLGVIVAMLGAWRRGRRSAAAPPGVSPAQVPAPSDRSAGAP
ncbi:MAG: hypothetical protein WAM92_02490 [Mycobacterium sp.]